MVTTWDDFLKAAQALTIKDGDQVTRYGFGQALTAVANQPSVAASMIMDKDGTLFHDDGRAAFATPTGIEGMTFATDLVSRYKVASPSAISITGEDLYDAFTSGRAAMILSNSGRVARLRGILQNNNVDFFPFPALSRARHRPPKRRAGRTRSGPAAR
jgi:ABC-type glycerol-3-phosphate transport system substrate-binding protein